MHRHISPSLHHYSQTITRIDITDIDIEHSFFLLYSLQYVHTAVFTFNYRSIYLTRMPDTQTDFLKIIYFEHNTIVEDVNDSFAD